MESGPVLLPHCISTCTHTVNTQVKKSAVGEKPAAEVSDPWEALRLSALQEAVEKARAKKQAKLPPRPGAAVSASVAVAKCRM